MLGIAQGLRTDVDAERWGNGKAEEKATFAPC